MDILEAVEVSLISSIKPRLGAVKLFLAALFIQSKSMKC